MRQRWWWAPPVTDHGLDHLFGDLQTILTPEEVADLLRMNKAAIYRWLNEGYLPGHKIGNNWRILRDDLHEWMRRGSNIGRRPAADDVDDADSATALEAKGQESPDP